jgi:hypothetical protein
LWEKWKHPGKFLKPTGQIEGVCFSKPTTAAAVFQKPA